ncbi:MAG: hypothetical protein H6Q31_2424, partial [Bacteroidetes bacterium]|nr:hypothetical protein [Bacteroidota bacterium]
LPAEDRAAVGFIETGTRGLFDSEDAETLTEGMVPGSAVIALAIEHTWALALVNALYQAPEMPGLMRGMARTAAVVGTATATRNAVNRRQADKNAQAYAQATQTAYAQAAPPPQETQYAPEAPAPAPEDDVIAQLERLGALKAQGLLTEEEFAAQKAKLLGS